MDINNIGGNRGLEVCVDNKYIKILVEVVGKINLCILLLEEYYNFFVECLFLDVENGEFYYVFMNDVLRYLFVCDIFILEIEKKEYD